MNPTPKTPSTGITGSLRRLATALLGTALVASLVPAHAAVIVKTNNTANLNLATSWTNSVAPGAADIAQWDAALSNVNNTTNTLGATVNWGGLKVISPAGRILINAGSTLTNGASGIDMSLATVDLALSNTVVIAPGALQQWNVAAGRTLSTLAIPTKIGRTTVSPPENTGVLQVGTTGTVKLGAAAATIINDNQGNPFVTYGLNDWAALDATGNVIAATYTDTAGAIVANVNNNIVTDIAGGAASAVFVSSVRFNDSTFRTLNVANSATTRTFSARGVLVTSNCVGGLIGGNTAASFIRGNATTTGAANNTSFNVIQNSPADFTITINIANNSSSTPNHLVKSGPGNLILTHSGNGYTGGTDINGGTLTAAGGASLGGGLVTINNTGRLVVNASNTTFVASLTVNSGATNRINVNSAGAQQYISGVNFITGSTACEFSFSSGVSPSTVTAPLLVSNVTANGSIKVNIYGGSMAVGQYPLIKYTNSLTGTGFPAFGLGLLPLRTLGYLSNNVANTSIDLVVTNNTSPIKWAVGGGNWDLATTANWKDGLGTVTTYQEANGFGDTVVFEDSLSGSSPLLVTNNATLKPATVTVDASKNYTLSGSGNIAGTARLTKTGTGTLTLATTNTFSGGLYLSNGIVNFSTVTNLGNGGVNFYGGTLQFASGNVDDISVRGIFFGAGVGTIDDGGNTITLAGPIGNSGTGSFAKTGAGSLTLTGTNKYSGATIVKQGTLVLGSSFTHISNSVSITISNGAVLDVNAKPALTLNGAISQTLSGNGTVSGNVTCPAGAAILPGASAGTLTMTDLIMSGGTNVLDIDVSPALSDLIVATNLTLTSGSIQLVASSVLTPGTYKLIQYSGGLLSGPGSAGNLNVVLTGTAQPNRSLTLSDATAGEIDLIVALSASDVITWNGASSANWDNTGVVNWQLMPGAAAWAYTNGDAVTLDEIGIAQNNVQLQNVLLPGSITVSNETATYTFVDGTGTGGGKISGTTKLTKKGPGLLILQTDNNNSGATDIQNGTLQVGNGGIGDLGSGNVTNNGALVFSQGFNHSVAGAISGTGPVTQNGASTLTLAANNSYAGATTIGSGASLQVGTGGAAGSLGAGSITNSGTLIYNKTGTFSVGSINTGIGGGGAVTFAGAATVTLNAGNTYENNTAVNGGSVTLSAANVIPSAATIPTSTGWLILDGGAASAGVLDLNGFNHTVNALSGLGNTFNGAITNTSLTATTNILTVLGSAVTSYNGSLIGNPGGAKIGLTLLGVNELRLNGNCSYTGPTLVGAGATLGVGPGYVTSPGLTVLSNGASFSMHANGSTSVFPGNNLSIADNSSASLISSSLANGFGGTVAGGATATNILGANISASSAAVKQFQGMTGTVQVATGGGLRFASTSLTVNGGDNATFQVDGGLNTRNGTASGAGISLGALTGIGTVSGAGNAAGNTIFVIGAKGVDATFPGTLTENITWGNVSVVKTGAGRQTLSGVASYTGNTTVNGGVLALVEPVSLDTSRTLTLAAGTLDVSGRTDGTLNLGNAINQILAGNGTINGSLFEAATTTNNLSLGVMAVTNVATINGALNLQINRTNAPNCSQLSALSFVNGGAITLTVANVGPTNLAAGDTFQLFNQAFPGSFVATNLPALPSAQLYWTNKVSINGSLAVASLVNLTPTNITSVVNGGNLELSWPTDHIGWSLQAQTNSLATGLSNNWVTIPGTATVSTYTNTINAANGAVFYRMVYP